MSQMSVSGPSNVQVPSSLVGAAEEKISQAKLRGRSFERLGDRATSALKAMIMPFTRIFAGIQEAQAKNELTKALKDYKAAILKSQSKSELSELQRTRGTALKNLVASINAQKSSPTLNKLMSDINLSETQKGLHLEILELQKQLELPDLTKNQKQEIQRELQAKVTALRTSRFGPEKAIAKGKAKQVYAKKADSENVYFTPIKGLKEKIIGSKRKEIQEELQTAATIKSRLEEAGIRGESNLALDMEVVQNQDRIGGRFTVKTQKAEGDLAKFILLKKIPFPQSAKVGLQIANGMSNLHRAGFCHGDSKPENILVYKSGRKDAAGNEEYDVRISDFGKTKEVLPNQRLVNEGNPRIAAPEGGLSQKGDVYNSAIMIIQTLEGELLSADHPMVMNPSERDTGVNSKGRYGIEKFLVENKNCPQTEVRTIGGKVRVYGREGAMALGMRESPEKLQKAETEVHLYIDKVVAGLSEKYPGKTDEINRLGILLKAMTRANPEERPSMETVTKLGENITRFL